MRSRPSRRSLHMAMAAAMTSAVLLGCGGDGDPLETQPAPDVSTFEAGRFDDLPLHPRSDAIGTRSEEDGVITQSYGTRGATTREVLAFYEDVLPDRGWTQVGQVEETGTAAHQGDWSSEGWSLRVSATDGSQLEFGGESSNEVLTQYSLVLTPT